MSYLGREWGGNSDDAKNRRSLLWNKANLVLGDNEKFKVISYTFGGQDHMKEYVYEYPNDFTCVEESGEVDGLFFKRGMCQSCNKYIEIINEKEDISWRHMTCLICESISDKEAMGGYGKSKFFEVYELIEKYGLENRCKLTGNLCFIFDDKYTYYHKKNKVKIKGHPIYRVANFESFIKNYLNVDNVPQTTKKKPKENIRKAVEEFELSDRCEYPHEDTVLVDGKYEYHRREKTVKIENYHKKYKMKNFRHFVEVFINGKKK